MQRQRYASWIEANPELARLRWREGYQRNVERIRDAKLDQHYRSKYGITREERDQLLAAQGGVCKICGGLPHPNHQGSQFHVDHCHRTGRIRGILCGHCNTMLGLAMDDPDRLQAAIDYLKETATGL